MAALVAIRVDALVRGDANRMLEILAPDFTYTNADGVACNRDEYLASYVGSDELVWLAQEMTIWEGAFCSSLDADSEGEEGKFYVWSRQEIVDTLGAEDAAFFAEHYDVTEGGNFEGHNILNRLQRPHPNPPPQAGEGKKN